MCCVWLGGEWVGTGGWVGVRRACGVGAEDCSRAQVMRGSAEGFMSHPNPKKARGSLQAEEESCNALTEFDTSARRY